MLNFKRSNRARYPTGIFALQRKYRVVAIWDWSSLLEEESREDLIKKNVHYSRENFKNKRT